MHSDLGDFKRMTSEAQGRFVITYNHFQKCGNPDVLFCNHTVHSTYSHKINYGFILKTTYKFSSVSINLLWIEYLSCKFYLKENS